MFVLAPRRFRFSRLPHPDKGEVHAQIASAVSRGRVRGRASSVFSDVRMRKALGTSDDTITDLWCGVRDHVEAAFVSRFW
jgi:hypothetical protein